MGARPSSTAKPWPKLSVGVYYNDAIKAIDFLEKAFGFAVETKILSEDKEPVEVIHSQLRYGNQVMIMVGSHKTFQEGEMKDQQWTTSPISNQGKCTGSICVVVEDANAHAEKARANGAKITMEVHDDDYGKEHGAFRSYQVLDLEGHAWFFMQILREPGIDPEA